MVFRAEEIHGCLIYYCNTIGIEDRYIAGTTISRYCIDRCFKSPATQNCTTARGAIFRPRLAHRGLSKATVGAHRNKSNPQPAVHYHCRQTRLGHHGRHLHYYPRNNAYARFDAVQLTSGSGTQDDKEAKRTALWTTVLSYTLALRFSALTGEHGPCRVSPKPRDIRTSQEVFGGFQPEIH